jgi:DNA invertase Pin-like site-specific DNA recombinase
MSSPAQPASAHAPLIPMVGYWRVSMVAREEPLSPDIQQRAGEAWAGQHGRRIVRWIGDPDMTGRNFDRRVQEAIAAVEAGEVAEIGVYRFDRWGRNTRESLACLKRVEDAGGGVVSWTEPFDSATAIGRFSRGQAFLLAELQSGIIGDNWKAAHLARVAKGLPADGKPRFGYSRAGRVPNPDRKGAWQRDTTDELGERYVPDPVTGPVLAELYARYAASKPVRALARWLNSTGVRSARGAASWSPRMVADVLASGFGAGLLRIHDPSCACGRNIGRCPRVLYLPGAHDPVISEETWEAFQARRQARAALPAPMRDPVYPLSGLLCCGSCGRRLVIARNLGGRTYRCTRYEMRSADCARGAYVTAAAAESAVLGWLGQWARDIEEQAAITAARARTARKAGGQRQRLATEEAALIRQLARLVASRASDEGMPAEVYEKAQADALSRLEAVRAALREAEQAENANTGEYLPVVIGLLEEWGTFTPAEKREILSAVITRVEVHRTGYRKPPRVKIVPVWEMGR